MRFYFQAFIADEKLDPNWPVLGKIEFKDVYLRFGDHAVLKNLTFTIKAGEKVSRELRYEVKVWLYTITYQMVTPTLNSIIAEVMRVLLLSHHLRGEGGRSVNDVI